MLGENPIKAAIATTNFSARKRTTFSVLHHTTWCNQDVAWNGFTRHKITLEAHTGYGMATCTPTPHRQNTVVYTVATRTTQANS